DVPRGPAQLLTGAFRGGDELRRIAGTARLLHGADRVAGNFAGYLDDLSDRKAAPIAQVIGVPPLAAAKLFHPQNMRVRQVADVDVVAHARPITRRVVSAEDPN